jgi:hypothetical protein
VVRRALPVEEVGGLIMLFAINFLVFQVAWLASVIGGAQQMPWLGPLSVLIAVGIHLWFARKPFDELALILACGVIGASFDSILVAAGWVSYTSGLFSDYIAPYWIITMWMLFATTLNVSMRFLRGRPLVSVVFGFFGGPLAYVTGEKLGGIIFLNQSAAMLALGVGWAVMMPLLMRLSESLDGMPGPRRRWLAEVSS